MNYRYRVSTLLVMALLPCVVAPLRAQQPEPEGDVAVLAILETDPSTPAEWARVAKILADLNRPELGKGFLKRVIDAKLKEPQLAELAEEFGSPMFLNMAGRQDMQPEAGQLADAILAAVNRQLQNPQRLAGLIKQLQDPSAEVRYQALIGLKEAHQPAVEALIGALADSNRAAEHDHLRAALARMGSEAVGPLLSLLDQADPELMIQAIRILTRMDVREAAIYLLKPYLSETTDPKVRAMAGTAIGRLVGHVPTKQQAAGMLTERAKAYFDGRPLMRSDSEGQVELWQWDARKRQSVAGKYAAEDASLVTAARLARDAYALAQEDPEVRRLYLATMLEAAVYANGLDQPLPEGEGTALAEAAAFGVEEIEDVLRYAMAGNRVGAATAAARILGQIGTAEALLRRNVEPAPLVRATRHSDRRLRMAATDAIVRLQPALPFPGSSYIPQSLEFFAATGGTRRALVAGPSREASRKLAGMLNQLGFEVDTAVTGRELIRLVTSSPDYELALIHSAIEHPTADLLLQQLRHDCRTATLRVGLIARSGSLERSRRIARRDPMTLAFSRPHDDQAVRWQVEQLATLAPRTFVPHAQRQHQAAVALNLLVELSGSKSQLYDLRRVQASVLAALYVPELGAKAVAVLGNLNSSESQQALVELASRWTQPLEVRMAAAQAFRINTQEHGILLRSLEITRQYDRYNQSENLDPGTQRVLGLILDCLEAPTQAAREKSGKPRT